MDQKPPQSSETPNQTPTAPSTPPTESSTPPAAPASPTPTASPNPTLRSISPNLPSPEHPQDIPPKKSKTMLFAIIALVVVLIGAGIVTFMNSSTKAPEVNTTVNEQVQVASTPTPVPSVSPTPGTLEDEVDAINTTENGSDLQEVDKDLQSL